MSILAATAAALVLTGCSTSSAFNPDVNSAVSPATTVALWMSSDTHRANILNPDYTKLAVGFNFDLSSDYKTYWSQFFSTY